MQRGVSFIGRRGNNHKWTITYTEGGTSILSTKNGNPIIITRGIDYPHIVPVPSNGNLNVKVTSRRIYKYAMTFIPKIALQPVYRLNLVFYVALLI